MWPGGPSRLLSSCCDAVGGSDYLSGVGISVLGPIVVSNESVWSFPNLGLFLIGGLSPLFNLLLAGGALLVGVTGESLEFISTDRLFNPVALFSLVAFAFIFPLVEEVGVRGYWLDRLQERRSALVAGVINGTVWAIWHAPFVLLPGYYANTTFEPELSWWLPMLVLNTIILVWVYNNTRRSILAVLLFHAFGYMTAEPVGFTPEMYPFVLSGYALVAVVLVAGWSPDSLCGWGVRRLWQRLRTGAREKYCFTRSEPR